MGQAKEQKADEKISVEFRLADMEVNEFFFNPQSDYPELGEDSEYFLEHGLKISDDMRTISVLGRVTLQVPKEDNDDGLIEVAGAGVTATFDVRNLETKEDESGEIYVPDPFVASLLGIVISTLRGVFISYGSGTPLSEYTLPVINPMDIVKRNYNSGDGGGEEINQ